MSHLGFVSLEGSLPVLFVTKNSSRVPTEPSNTPLYRVYGSTGALMANGTGSASKKDTGTVTGATQATPIVITSASHGLKTGVRVTVTDVGGNTNANTTTTITRVDDNSFQLDSTVGNGAYTSGGSWHVTGLWGFSLSVAANDGYETGKTYTIVVQATVGGNVYCEEFTFTVV